MKQLLMAALTLSLIAACNQPVRYTQTSPEIDTVKELIDNYDSKSYDTSLYADSSKTYYNTKENPLSPAEAMAYHQENDANYSDRSFETEGQEFEMVVTDDGETWVNCWLDWGGTIAATGKEIAIPVHLTFQFKGGKIVREHGYWDPTEVVLEMQKVAAQAAAEEEKEEE